MHGFETEIQVVDAKDSTHFFKLMLAYKSVGHNDKHAWGLAGECKIVEVDPVEDEGEVYFLPLTPRAMRGNRTAPVPGYSGSYVDSLALSWRHGLWSWEPSSGFQQYKLQGGDNLPESEVSMLVKHYLSSRHNEIYLDSLRLVDVVAYERA